MSAAQDATAQALAVIAQEKGLPLTSEQTATLVQQAADLLANFITAALENKVRADEAAAVANITTLDEAETSARKPR